MKDKLMFFPFMLILFVIVVGVSSVNEISAEIQKNPTNDGSLDVQLEFDDGSESGDQTKLKIEFINPTSKQTQEHIDYTVTIKNDGDSIFGPIPLTHTSLGSVSIPVSLEDGTNIVTISVEGILFVPISPETVTFDVVIGEQTSSPQDMKNENFSSDKIPSWVKSNAEWWAANLIDDATFVSGIQFLISEKIINVSSSSTNLSSDNNDAEIPKWIKNNADWWSKEMISDNDFLKGIEFLVENRILSVSTQTSESDSFRIGGIDLSQASPVFGSEDAGVTIIEFGDYQCPNCKKWFENTKPDIVTNYLDTGKANLYFMDLPFLGDDSLPASSATYCAGEQGLYWEYHSHLYSSQRGIDSGWANLSSLQNYAELLGLDESLFANCMDSGKYDELVLLNLEIGVLSGVEATPWFIVVGPDEQKQSIKGPQPFPVFEAVIEPMLD